MRPAWSRRRVSARPIIQAGQIAARKHRASAPPRPIQSLPHGMTSSGRRPPKKLTYCEMPEPHLRAARRALRDGGEMPGPPLPRAGPDRTVESSPR